MKWKKTLKMRAEGRDAKKEREQVRSIKKWGNFLSLQRKCNAL